MVRSGGRSVDVMRIVRRVGALLLAGVALAAGGAALGAGGVRAAGATVLGAGGARAAGVAAPNAPRVGAAGAPVPNAPRVSAAGAPAPNAPRVSAASRRSAPTLAANRRAARRDAHFLLSRLRVPPGATAVAEQPVGADGWLKPMTALTGTSTGAETHAWWTVSGTPAAVLAEVRSRPPLGGTLFGTGTSGDSRTGRVVQELDYDWPAIPGVIRSRELMISVTAVSAGVTGVLAQAESEWTVPRPLSERIPVGTHEIDINVAIPGGPVARRFAVTDPGTIRRMVALFNAMPIAQPGTYACPLEIDPRLFTFTFRAQPGAAALAQATDTAYGSKPVSGPCSPIQFSVAGRRQDPLIGGNIVEQVQRLLGVMLAGVATSQ